MKFRYYIVNHDSGRVFGTNDSELAVGAAEDEILTVIDSQQGCTVETLEGATTEIKEWK